MLHAIIRTIKKGMWHQLRDIRRRMRSKGRKVNVLQLPPGVAQQHKNHPGHTRKDAAIYT